MTRRPMILPLAALLLGCLALLPACKKNKTDGGGGGSGGGDDEHGPGQTPPARVSSDYVVFAKLNVKDVTDSPVFAELKQAFDKAGGTAEWDKAEREVSSEIGVKPTDIESVTALVTDVPPRDVPKFVLIVTSRKAFDKAGVLKLGPQAKPDARGFYNPRGAPGLLHFPNDKTMVLLHPDLASKYLDGYAKDRAGWPMTAELSKAAAGHTAFVSVQLDKLPGEMRKAPDLREFGPLLEARSLTVTADLKGRELSVAARAGFQDAAAAGKAKDVVRNFIGLAVGEVQKVMEGKSMPEFGALGPAVKEAHRALKEAKVEVSGSDLTVAGSYKADFDIGAMVAGAVPKIREAAARTTAQNNLKQIALALHNYHSVYNQVPVLGVEANAQPLRNATDKPLLSWRVAMLPYLEQENLYREFRLNEPWDSEHNKKLIAKMPKIYAPVNKPGKEGYTHMQMVVGPNAMQPPVARIPASFPDGTSNTIAVVEAAEPVVWTKPDDLMLPGKDLPKDFRKKFGGLFPGGFNVAMWDGSVRFVPDTVSDRTLSLAFNPRDGMPLGSDW
jgi:prepilin-type processing-associated H-X9-DG protein